MAMWSTPEAVRNACDSVSTHNFHFNDGDVERCACTAIWSAFSDSKCGR